MGPLPWQGGRKWTFPICPWNSEHRNRSAYIVELRGGALDAGCHHNGCAGKDWYALRDLYEPGWREGDQRRTPARSTRGRERQAKMAALWISALPHLRSMRGQQPRRPCATISCPGLTPVMRIYP
jgi:hypothetical protein